MRKLTIVGIAALIAGMIGSSAHATPLAAASAPVNGVVERAAPDEGVTKVWYRRHHGWYRGHHYGWGRHHWRHYSYWHRY